MKIIKPAHNKPSFVVPSWKFMENEAKRLRVFIKTAKFEGLYQKAFALAHAEVSVAPLNFFVVDEEPFEVPAKKNSKEMRRMLLKKEFGSWCIINPRIIQFGDPVYWKEACMGFPYRQAKNTDRMNKITAEYYIPFLWGWRKVKRKLEGLPAFIMQHCVEHCTGQNIYFKKEQVKGKAIEKKHEAAEDCQFCAVEAGSTEPVDITGEKEFMRLFKIHEKEHTKLKNHGRK